MPLRPPKKLTFLSAAGYLLIFALCAKAVSLYASQHPGKGDLLAVRGTVTDVRLGGPGQATWLIVASEGDSRRYSSWFGRDWPGMEEIRSGDAVALLAERKRLNRSRPFRGAEYDFWELRHGGKVVVPYGTVAALVAEKEEAFEYYVDGVLAASLLLWAIAYVHRAVRQAKGPRLPD